MDGKEEERVGNGGEECEKRELEEVESEEEWECEEEEDFLCFVFLILLPSRESASLSLF